MKTMTCKQLGGVCNQKFRGNTFEEIGELSKKHGMEMYKKGDAPHIEAMNKMRVLMSNPAGMKKCMDGMRKEFDALPNDS